MQRYDRRVRDRLDRSRAEIRAELHALRIALDPAKLRSFLGLRGLRLALNVGVAVLVVSLPLAATAASQPVTDGLVASQQLAVDPGRATTVARGGIISAGREPVTVQAPGLAPIREQVIGKNDSLGSMANFYGVSPEAIAYANGITDPSHIELGRALRIPPADGALYTVVAGDTVESVAARFKVDAAVVMDYNRLYFEPEHFAPGQLVFVPGATLPGLVYIAAEPDPEPAPTVIARPVRAPAAPAARTGRLAWPVGGVITQYFWAGHTGVDIAAPFGTGIAASEDGVVTATGLVPVGGIRVCLKHADGLETCYYHTHRVYVEPGNTVVRGQIIAIIGMTGVTTGPHVHWECKKNGVLLNCLAQ
ncbi:MAG: M23 family metallopeptidase [Chloroflexi bacterium]|nr:M23 family metallopeptidase [Chloroflexota bacterium]